MNYYERYELKFLITKQMMNSVIQQIESYCNLDIYSQKAFNGFYRVNSLYFDTEKFHLLERKRDNFLKRFNLRVRSYGDNPIPPYFWEIKVKSADQTVKKRAAFFYENWDEYLLKGDLSEVAFQSEINRKNAEEFLYTVHRYNLEPKILTQYERKAFSSTIDNYVRITFDKNLRFQENIGYSLLPNEKLMQNYDIPEIFCYDSEQSIIMEIKCEKRVPYWLLDLIHRNELVRVSFSKYENAIKNILESNFTPKYYRVAKLSN